MTDAATSRRGHSRCRFSWDKVSGRAIDRWGRNAEEVREHVEFVTVRITELHDFVDRCFEQVQLGREVGPKFKQRFEANIAGLERVLERDRWHAEVLEEAEEQQRFHYERDAARDEDESR
jgi:DNA invertase Pin-like site-specific DNA recombinase